jgi:hypothetical protein
MFVIIICITPNKERRACVSSSVPPLEDTSKWKLVIKLGKISTCRIKGSHSGTNEADYLLWSNALYNNESQLPFQNIASIFKVK